MKNRQNHSPDFQARVALETIRKEKTLAERSKIGQLVVERDFDRCLHQLLGTHGKNGAQSPRAEPAPSM